MDQADTKSERAKEQHHSPHTTSRATNAASHKRRLSTSSYEATTDRSYRADKDEEEELDEFGRVKRRRQKFARTSRYEEMEDRRHTERVKETEREEGEEEGEDRRSYGSESDDDYERSRYHYRRRRSSGRRYYSDSDSEDDYRRRRRGRRPSSSSGHRRHDSDTKDPYAAAARYIDTEFYSTKIYVGDLVHVTQDDFERAFLRYGPIRQIKMVEGKEYAFVTYEDKESALAAIQNMHGALFGSRRIKVNRAKIPERNRVGFGNVPWTDEDGRLAQEEQRSYPDRPESSPSFPSVDAPVPPPRRVLTSYDDL
ncbi:hypothetical protein EC973_001049 [Apophysomyces ossiformis]|uniref:RRM domain-containing protein n=1 Tax=Apophysomyces ossiformis TaxID=679940 RepID=A0A8H7EV72_9FUNG|nr:hypothetical protein EC973_001049 [Apophysomyces ossiformis]